MYEATLQNPQTHKKMSCFPSRFEQRHPGGWLGSQMSDSYPTNIKYCLISPTQDETLLLQYRRREEKSTFQQSQYSRLRICQCISLVALGERLYVPGSASVDMLVQIQLSCL